jgi:hypothetical protein
MTGSTISSCQDAINALTTVEDFLAGLVRARQEQGAQLFAPSGGNWQGPDADAFRTVALPRLLNAETNLLNAPGSSVRALIGGLQAVQAQIPPGFF